MTASSDNDVRAWERERKEDEAREEIILSGSPGVVSLSCKASSSLPFSLVSSALPSSRLMEQSMQIARVNRARDRREEGREITPASGVSPQLLPSAGTSTPPPPLLLLLQCQVGFILNIICGRPKRKHSVHPPGCHYKYVLHLVSQASESTIDSRKWRVKISLIATIIQPIILHVV